MKVALIYPPQERTVRGPISKKITAISGFPPLHLLSIAAQVEQIPGVEVRLIDCRLEGIDPDSLRKNLSANVPDIIGISVNTFMLLDALEVSRIAKEISSRTLVVWGGIHPTIYPCESIRFPSVDALVRGEGEYAFAKLVEAVIHEQDFTGIPGVVSKLTEDPASVATQEIENLDDLQPPAWHLSDTRYYVREHKPVMWLLSSRGCVGRCTFCYLPAHARRYRYHSVKYVIDHLRHLVDTYGLDEFYIADDCFTVNKKRVIEFCEALSSLPCKLRWGAVSRIDTLNEEVITAMSGAGCQNIYLGIETGDANIQKVIKKNLKLEKIEHIVEFAQRAGMNPHGYFMIGHPQEDASAIRRTLDFMKRLPLSGIAGGVAIFQPYPNTTAYEQGLKDHIITEDYWLKFATHPTADFACRFWNEIFTDEELLQWQKKINSAFYFRPVMVWRTLREAWHTHRIRSKFRSLRVYLQATF
jgi:radical SAM superfamily enzyme YgiQ (UPF0313 family)